MAQRDFFFSICLVVLASLWVGCSGYPDLSQKVDGWLFERMGITLIAKPELLSLKEIHLDTGVLVGRQVVVEGHIQMVGDLGTYVILEDQSGRMLIRLTNAKVHNSVFGSGEFIRVLGVIESGKKGMPYVAALSVRAHASVPK